jgi:multidrug efflux pump subunit AcrB
MQASRQLSSVRAGSKAKRRRLRPNLMTPLPFLARKTPLVLKIQGKVAIAAGRASAGEP